MDWQQRYAQKRATLEAAIGRAQPGHNIFIGSGAAEPISLVEELVRQADRFDGNTILHLLTLGPAPYVEARYEQNFRHKALFIGPNVRRAVHEGRADYTPVFLSQIPQLIRARRLPVDVALIQATPPDDNGYVNLGVSVDIVLRAVQSAQLVIAQINPRMPVVHGYGYVPMRSIDAWVLDERPLPEVALEPLDSTARAIGRYVAELIEDGSTLQLGIGQVPDAVLKALTKHRDLGLWTEMFSDGVIDLIENGNLNSRLCTTNPDRATASFTFGSQRLYEYINNNPFFVFGPSNKVNDPREIAAQHKMVAINSALQVDLTGQVCADSIGGHFYSGIGGQVDFIRGASMNKGGRPIIALRSTAKGGTLSRIVPVLDEGAGVVTSRGDVEFVVTEHGVADLRGRSVRARSLALASIADPDFRAELLNAARARKYVPMHPVKKDSALTFSGRFERQVECPDSRRVLVRIAREADYAKIGELLKRLETSDAFTATARPHGADARVATNRTAGIDASAIHLVAVQLDQVVGLAVGQCDRATGAIDLEITVDPRWRFDVLQSALLLTAVDWALTAGLSALTSCVPVEDNTLLRAFHSLALPVESTLADGCYCVRIALPHRDRRTDDAGPPLG